MSDFSILQNSLPDQPRQLPAAPAVRRTRTARMLTSLDGLLRLIVAAAFCFSGLSHAEKKYDFVASVFAYDLLPFSFSIWLASIFPLILITNGVFLIFDVWRNLVRCISAAILLVFGVAAVGTLVRDMNIPCGCFGIISPQVTWMHAALNLAFGFALVAPIFLRELKKS